MATIKLKFRPSTDSDRKGTIYYQILHDRKVRQLNTKYHVYADEWDEKRSVIFTKRISERRDIVLRMREEINWDLERFSRIIRKLENKGFCYSADDIAEEFRRYRSEYTLFIFMESIILKLRRNGKTRTSETYTAALKSFRKYRRQEDLMLDCISPEVMEDYQAWLENRSLSANTISFYTRILRAVYNRAVDNDIIDDRNPFRRVYTGIDKTVKRALPLQIIKKIKSLDLSGFPNIEFARDMFMMSFYFRGMSFIDMSFLRKSDLRNGYIVYRRRKTGQILTIAWTTEMQSILDKYPRNPTQYLLPILCSSGVNELFAYRNVGYKINNNLKKVAEKIGIRIPLTLYVARHSWASIARLKGVPLSVISEGMGHDSESTTRIYLSSLDTTLVDKANRLILKSLK